MSALAADVGRVIWSGVVGTAPTAALRRAVATPGLGGVFLSGRNLRRAVVPGPVPQRVTDVAALRELCAGLHAAAPSDGPIAVAIDHEGGAVQRVRAPATQWPPMLALEHHGAADVELAQAIGAALGAELAAIGVDVDFAPVLDVLTNPDNPVIGDRALGRRPDEVARRGKALAAGLAAAGVIACGKHFPGHGDTREDSHLTLPRVDHPRARLEAIELAPFAAATELPMIMTAHVLYPAWDPDRPATQSPWIIGELLRARLGYQGLVISDDLGMGAVAAGGPGAAAVRAIAAGCDAVLIARDPDQQGPVRAALTAAAVDDPRFRARLARAAERGRALAVAQVATRRARPAPGLDAIGAPAHRALADRLAGI